ncbi:hypothetical protein ACMGD3_23875 [Lysinibacillus sphaericus]|uniref:hypothetical protein n=1 Tax=Lysinibacillus sphaericus TaxID=1421 RepID=UPI003F7AE76D
MYSLAHELGHHYQHQRYPALLYLSIYLARKNHIFSLIFYPFLLWWELDAWLKAWRICKDEKIPLGGFIDTASKALFSYIIGFFNQIINVIKYVIGLYISIVFFVKFLKVSEEMNLQQPEFLLSFRELLGTQSYNELVSSMFGFVLFIWIFTLCLYLGVMFLGFNFNYKQSYGGKHE